MAELVGLAASIIQIAGVGVKLSTTLYNFVGSATRADQEITDIAGDVEITANALDSVGKVFEDEDAPSVVSKKAIEHANSLIKRCEAVFGEIHEVIDKRRKTSKDGKKSLSALGKLSWPMKEQKIELLRRRLESLKNSLILLFHVLQLANGQARGKLEKSELEREREKIRELHQRQQDSIQNLEALEAKFRKATIDDDETLSGSTTISRISTFNLMAIPSLPIEKFEKKPDSQLRTRSATDTTSLIDDSEMSDSEGTVTDEEAEHLTIDELSQCAKHVQKLLKGISTLQETFETTKPARRLPKTRVHKLYRRFCQKFESQVTPRASVTVQDSLLPLPAFVPPSKLESQQKPTYEALSRNFSIPDAFEKIHKPQPSLSAPPLPRGDYPHSRFKTPSVIQPHSRGMISRPSNKPMPISSQSSSGENTPTSATPKSESVLFASNGNPPKTVVEIPSTLDRVQDVDFLTLAHQSMPNHRDSECAMMEAEEHQHRMHGSDEPITNKVHKSAKRASCVLSSLELESESTRTKDKKGANKASPVSVSNPVNIINGGSGDEVRLRVYASAPLSLQFNGDMEGRTLKIDPVDRAMAIIGMRSHEKPREKSSHPLNEQPDPEDWRDGNRRVLKRGREINYNEGEPGPQKVASEPPAPRDETGRYIVPPYKPRTRSASISSRESRERRQTAETKDCTDPSCTKCVLPRRPTTGYGTTRRNAQPFNVVDRLSRENGSQRQQRPPMPNRTSSNYNPRGRPLLYGPPLVTQVESSYTMPSARYAPPSQSRKQTRLAQSESSESECSTEDEVGDRYPHGSRALMPPPPVTKPPDQRRPSLRHAATTRDYDAGRRMSVSQSLPEHPLVTSQTIMERRREREAQRVQLKASPENDEKAERHRQTAGGISGTEPVISLHSTFPLMGQAKTAQQGATSRAPGSDFRTEHYQSEHQDWFGTELKSSSSSETILAPAPLLPASRNAFRRGHKKTLFPVAGGTSMKTSKIPDSAYAPLLDIRRPMRQPHGAPPPEELEASATSNHKGSKNVSVRRRTIQMVSAQPPAALIPLPMAFGLMASVDMNIQQTNPFQVANFQQELTNFSANSHNLTTLPTEQWLELRSIQGGDNEWKPINTGSRRKSFDINSHPPALIFDPSQALHIRTNSDSSQHVQASASSFSSYEEIHFLLNSPQSEAENSLEPIQPNHTHSRSKDHHHDTSYPKQEYANYISPDQSVSPPNAVVRPYVDLTLQPSTSSTPHQPSTHEDVDAWSSDIPPLGDMSDAERQGNSQRRPSLLDNVLPKGASTKLLKRKGNLPTFRERGISPIRKTQLGGANAQYQNINNPPATENKSTSDVVCPSIDSSFHPSTYSTPYQTPTSEVAVPDSSSCKFVASPGSPCRKRTRDETTEQPPYAEHTPLATPILKSKGDMAATTDRKAEILTKRAKLRDLKEQRRERMEAFPLAEKERRTETHIHGVYSSRSSHTGYRASSPMTDWDSVKISPTDDWRVIEYKRAKRNDMVKRRRELRREEKREERMKATPITQASSMVDDHLDHSRGPYGAGPSSSQGIEQHYSYEEDQSPIDTDLFAVVGFATVDAESNDALMQPCCTNKPPVVRNEGGGGPINDPNYSISAPNSGYYRLDYDTIMTESRGVEKDIVDLLLEEWTVVPVC